MAEKVNYFDGVKSHFDELQIKVIEVPEWDLVGDKAIYAKPFNMLDKLNFKTHADTDVVARVANQILGTGYDDIKKN